MSQKTVGKNSFMLMIIKGNYIIIVILYLFNLNVRMFKFNYSI